MRYILLSISLLAGVLHAQSPCNLSNFQNCVFNPLANFVVISSDRSFSQMILDGDLLPPAQSLNTPQFLIVCGRITDDLNGFYDFAPGTEIVFRGSTSGITVNNGCFLRLRGSLIHGCEEHQTVWSSITVESGGGLILLSCEVKDAQEAIVVKAGGLLISNSSFYERNETSMLFGEDGSPNQHNIIASLSGNTFSGSNSLWDNRRPRYGIRLRNVRYLTVGGGVSQNVNIFRDYNLGISSDPVGIWAQNSSLRVLNTSFRNIGNGRGGRGIFFDLSAGAISSLHLTGLGSSPNSPNTFDGVQEGVYGLGNITVNDCRFNNLAHGVYVVGFPGPYQVFINRNHFQNIYSNSLWLRQVSTVNGITVQRNLFEDNSSISPSISLIRAGILVSLGVIGEQRGWIHRNIFVNSPFSKPSGFSGRYNGIYMGNIEGYLIERNEFIDDFSSPNSHYYGVTLNRARSLLWSNEFRGIGNWQAHPSTAVEVVESRGSWINCNTFDLHRRGVYFQGNCDGTRLERNFWNTHDRGLVLHRSAIIGQQKSRYNRWIGSGSNLEAHFEDLNLEDPDERQYIWLSRFWIHDPDMNSDFWPSPRYVGSVPDDGTWFITDQNPGQSPICQQTLIADTIIINIDSLELVPEITEVDRRVMEGTYQPEGGFPAGHWEAAFHLYTKLLRYDELRPAGSQEALWFDTQEGTTVAKIGRVYDDILSLSRYSSSEQAVVNAAVAACTTYERLLEVKDHQIGANAEHDALLLALIDERDSLLVHLAGAQDNYSSLMNGFRSARKFTAQQVLHRLDSIQTDTYHEYAAKEVCRIWLWMYLNDTFPSLVQGQWLGDVARQCRYSAGLAVVWARSMLLSEPEDWTLYDDCLPGRPLKTVEASPSSIRLYPNPTRREVTLEHAGDAVLSGRILLRDISGKILQEWYVSGQAQVLLRWDRALHAGFYWVEYIAESGMSTVLKVLIQPQD